MIKIFLKMSYQTVKSRLNRWLLKYKGDEEVYFLIPLKYKKDLGVDSLFYLWYILIDN